MLALGGVRQGAGRVHLESKSKMSCIDSSFQWSGMLTGNGQAAGDVDPLPLSALCDMACVDVLLYATGRVAVLVGRLPVARPWLLTNEALGGGARGRGHDP